VVCLGWWREWRELQVLPYPGDLLDQPAFVVEAIETCEGPRLDALAEARAREQEELEELRRQWAAR